METRRYACVNDRTVVPGSQETRVPERGWVLATWLLATHAWISPAYARVNIVGSTLLPHPPVRANRIHVIAAAGWRFPLYLCLCFSFPYPKADSSSVAYTTGREYTTSHISTQTSPGSPSTSTRDIVTDSVQYNVSTTDLETSHVRWVCQFLARTPAATLEPRRHTNSANSSGVRCACTSICCVSGDTSVPASLLRANFQPFPSPSKRIPFFFWLSLSLFFPFASFFCFFCSAPAGCTGCTFVARLEVWNRYGVSYGR